jgi:hypothetical protein
MVGAGLLLEVFACQNGRCLRPVLQSMSALSAAQMIVPRVANHRRQWAARHVPEPSFGFDANPPSEWIVT